MQEIKYWNHNKSEAFDQFVSELSLSYHIDSIVITMYKMWGTSMVPSAATILCTKHKNS